MLHELRVRNFLLIDTLELSFSPGFNVLTGETGAGKSVVIGALQLVLGGRAGSSQVRPGADAAEIEALFDLTNSPKGLQRLREVGIDNADDLVVRRVLHSSNRSRAFLNGRLCSVAELSQMAPDLADIASQHESTSLSDVATHVGYLDAFGGLEADRDQMARSVQELKELAAEVSRLRTVVKDRVERREFLMFQLSAIEDVAPRAGERDDLQAERLRLRHAARLLDVVGSAANSLTSDSGLCDRLRSILGDLSAIVDLDPSLREPTSRIEAALDQLDEGARSLERYADNMEVDPDRLDSVEHRLYQLEKLLRRHGPTESEALAAADGMRASLASLEEVDEALGTMERRFDDALSRVGEFAFALSARRSGAAALLAERIGQELSLLGMGGAQVRVDVARHVGEGELSVRGAKLTPDGVDRVELLIAPNKGIEPRPLRKIASGGELSRALLAIKRVLSSQGPAGLYVFDEVDAGVGGAVAEQIGRALADIAKHRQVLCITHLAPIAALADSHFVVRKSQEGEVARTDVVCVTGEERVREIARMLSGKNVTKASMNTAREMVAGRDRE